MCANLSGGTRLGYTCRRRRISEPAEILDFRADGGVSRSLHRRVCKPSVPLKTISRDRLRSGQPRNRRSLALPRFDDDGRHPRDSVIARRSSRLSNGGFWVIEFGRFAAAGGGTLSLPERSQGPICGNASSAPPIRISYQSRWRLDIDLANRGLRP